MPIPDEPSTIQGGCDCGAVRYRVAVPAAAERPPHPLQQPPTGTGGGGGAATPVVLPNLLACHCGFCRHAPGALVPAYVNCAAYMVTVSALPMDRDDAVAIAAGGRGAERLVGPEAARVAPGGGDEDEQEEEEEEERKEGGENGEKQRRQRRRRPPYLPAADVLQAGSAASRGTWLRFYRRANCGPGAARSFCGRCGTSIGYHFKIRRDSPRVGMPPEGWDDMLDLALGSVDREDLERPWMRPDRQVSWDSGVPWIRDLVGGELGTRYPDGTFDGAYGSS